jgi:hypothetical protein
MARSIHPQSDQAIKKIGDVREILTFSMRQSVQGEKATEMHKRRLEKASQ